MDVSKLLLVYVRLKKWLAWRNVTQPHRDANLKHSTSMQKKCLCVSLHYWFGLGWNAFSSTEPKIHCFHGVSALHGWGREGCVTPYLLLLWDEGSQQPLSRPQPRDCPEWDTNNKMFALKAYNRTSLKRKYKWNFLQATKWIEPQQQQQHFSTPSWGESDSLKSLLNEERPRYHGILDLRRSQPLATDVDDVIHPSRDPVVSVTVTKSTITSEVQT